ncbi:MAG: CcmD family protein [Polyangiaceae bacterium]
MQETQSDPIKDRSTEFKAVEGGPQTTSGEMLLTQAYAAFWIFAFVLVFFSIRKQSKLDERVSRLQEELSKARSAYRDKPVGPKDED